MGRSNRDYGGPMGPGGPGGPDMRPPEPPRQKSYSQRRDNGLATVSLTIPYPERDQLDRMADSRGVSRSQLLRDIVEKALR